jgi:hypothetical protein
MIQTCPIAPSAASPRPAARLTAWGLKAPQPPLADQPCGVHHTAPYTQGVVDAPIQPPPAWQAAQFRLTVFLARAAAAQENLWERLTGIKPTAISQQPVTRTVREEGPFASSFLVVVQSHRRCDLVLGPQPDPTAGLPVVPFVEDTEAAAKDFAGLAKKLLEHCQGLRPTRLAYGAVMMEPVDTRADGYARLQKFLPDYQFREGVTDFQLQLNRRRESTSCSGVQINRLSKWSVVIHQTALVNFGHPGAPLQAVEVQQEDEIHACRC